MSAYVDFYLRYKDNFIPIDDFSRSSRIYETFGSFARWEKLRVLTQDTLEKFAETFDSEIKDCKQRIAKTKEFIELVKTSSDSFADKLEYINDYQNTIKDIEQDMKEYEYGKSFMYVLINMIDTARYSDNLNIDIAHYIYVGIEVGHPSLDDLIEE